MTPPHGPVTAARHALQSYNAKRYDPVQRDLFWNADRWEALFQALVDAEAARDAALQRQIADRTLSSAYLPSYEEQLFTQLQQDERWYASEAAACARYVAPPPSVTSVITFALEFARHTLLLEQRLLDRRARQAEVGLEIIERRRRARGLPHGAWTGGWQRLSAAWADQDTWHQLLCDGEERLDLGVSRIPDTWRQDASAALEERLDGRLAWLRELQGYQQESERVAGQASLDTRDLRADMVVVAQAISRLAPPPARSGTPRAAVAAALSVLAVTALALLIGAAVIGRGGDRLTAPAADTPALVGHTVQRAIRGGVPINTVTRTPAPTTTVEVDRKAVARALLDSGACADAVGAYEAAIQAAPDDYELYNDVAFCLYDLGRVDEAVMRWNQALMRNPDSADARAGLAIALLTQGHTAAALDNYARALAIAPEYADPAFLREQRSWSENALIASQPLRDTLVVP